MLNFSATWNQLLADLERERDELRLQLRLGKAEARDQFKEAERKLAALRTQLNDVEGTAKSAAATTATKAKAIAAEIRESFARIRKIL